MMEINNDFIKNISISCSSYYPKIAITEYGDRYYASCIVTINIRGILKKELVIMSAPVMNGESYEYLMRSCTDHCETLLNLVRIPREYWCSHFEETWK